MYETPASIIKSLPPRPVVDRLVSRYFNVLDIAPGMLPNLSIAPRNSSIYILTNQGLGVVHSSHFLREVGHPTVEAAGFVPYRNWFYSLN